MRRGEYGFDAPYAPLVFGTVSVAGAVASAVSWRQGDARAAARMGGLSALFLVQVLSGSAS